VRKEGSISFLKKGEACLARSKKRLRPAVRVGATMRSPRTKSFLLLFFKKEVLA
jgi:hypothetical protein